ncbi:very-long-chain 3-oxoacyl-CoA reductase-like isoform X1 [Leptotrombidium deliense]|uniref:Very-long-chain 3-oxoacyl-CoA reductase-like isoform X1 n=1 Tax=Leptotrombidium deliense TaxID=299467 RepID=A0A443RTJ5_9ACAR|nr:very-long-chain 3-oxoacyl-CoA reductase-like isoform X1 [Leptotrombidium deliense]
MGKPSLSSPTPEKFAISSIATIGLSSHTSGYWVHGLQSLLITAMPRSLYYWITGQLIFNYVSTIEAADYQLKQ